MSRLQADPVVHGFERAAACYDDYAMLQRRVGDEMLDRLQYIRLQPDTVVDIGCGTGHCTRGLRGRYRKARLVGLDRSGAMLAAARRRRRLLDRTRFVRADAHCLPLASASSGLVFSNLMLQWCDPRAVFTEFRRILADDGLLMFATFGPDTLKELRHAWAEVDDRPHVIDFPDMHDLGDMLLQTGFRDPVMDVDRHVLSYRGVLALLRDLHGIGSRNVDAGRRRGLMGRDALQRLERAYRRIAGQSESLPASYEVVYGHAWAGGGINVSALPEQVVMLDNISGRS